MLAQLLSLAVFLPHQGPDDPQQILSKMRDAYARVKSATFYVKFAETDPSGLVGRGEARIDFLAPNMLRAAFKGLPKGPAILLCDGKRLATFSADGRKLEYTYTPDMLEKNLPTNSETYALFDANRDLSTAKGGAMEGSTLDLRKGVEWNGKKYWVLRENSASDNLYVDYYFDPATMLIWKTFGLDLKTKRPFIETEVSDLEINPKIVPARFKIPAGRAKIKKD